MNAATRRTARQNTVHDENKVQHTRMTRSKLASSTDLASLSTTALPSKVGNNKAGPAATRKRAALGDVTNAHKKGAPLGDITNAVLKKQTTDKPTTTLPAKRPISRKPSVVNVKKAAAAPAMTTTTTVTTLTSTTVVESKPLASKQNAQITNGPSVVIPKKRSSEAVAPTTKRGSENVAPRRTLKQSTSTSSLAQKGMTRTASRRRAEEPAEPEAPRKKQKVEPVQDWEDLDAADANDPFMVSEYVNEIFDYMRVLEIKSMPNPDYMKHQVHLQWRMRGILVDWLIEVHAKFRLLPETLFLGVNLVDRFLTARTVTVERLQLIGITALLIASKYEEVMAPSIEAFIYIADGGYTEEEILKAERYLLKIVSFDLSYPNPMNFLRRISKADDYDIHTRTIAKYLIEISLVDDRFLRFTPSLVAAAGMFLSRQMMERGSWSANLVHYSGYTALEVRPVVCLMVDYLARKEVLHDAFFKKYAAKKYMKASILVHEWIRTNFVEAEEIPAALAELIRDTEEEEEAVSHHFQAGYNKETQLEENDTESDKENEASDEEDYMFADELEAREVDEGYELVG